MRHQAEASDFNLRSINIGNTIPLIEAAIAPHVEVRTSRLNVNSLHTAVSAAYGQLMSSLREPLIGEDSLRPIMSCLSFNPSVTSGLLAAASLQTSTI